MRFSLRWQQITDCARSLTITCDEGDDVRGFIYVCDEHDQHMKAADDLAAYMCFRPCSTPEDMHEALATWLWARDITAQYMCESAYELQMQLSPHEEVTYSTPILGLRIADVGDMARGYMREWLDKYGLEMEVA